MCFCHLSLQGVRSNDLDNARHGRAFLFTILVHDSSTVNTRHPRITRTRTGAWMSNPAAASQSPRICNQGTRRERRCSGTSAGYS